MFHKDLRPALGRSVSPAEAYRRADPQRRAAWFPYGPPPGAGAGASWDRPPDPGSLAKAEQVARTYLAAAYGPPVRPDGLVPCMHCARCDVGAFGRCAKALSPAEARLRAGQAGDADRAAAAIVAAELAMLHVELSAELG